jgi:hypothetical protein
VEKVYFTETFRYMGVIYSMFIHGPCGMGMNFLTQRGKLLKSAEEKSPNISVFRWQRSAASQPLHAFSGNGNFCSPAFIYN